MLVASLKVDEEYVKPSTELIYLAVDVGTVMMPLSPLFLSPDSGWHGGDIMSKIFTHFVECHSLQE